MITVIQFPAARVHVIHSEPLPNILDDIDSSEDFISRVLFSPPSRTSELRDRQLCGVVVNRLQIVIMDTSRLYGSWSASVRSYRILMWTGRTGANLHDRCHDLSESGSA